MSTATSRMSRRLSAQRAPHFAARDLFAASPRDRLASCERAGTLHWDGLRVRTRYVSTRVEWSADLHEVNVDANGFSVSSKRIITSLRGTAFTDRYGAISQPHTTGRIRFMAGAMYVWVVSARDTSRDDRSMACLTCPATPNQGALVFDVEARNNTAWAGPPALPAAQEPSSGPWTVGHMIGALNRLNHNLPLARYRTVLDGEEEVVDVEQAPVVASLTGGTVTFPNGHETLWNGRDEPATIAVIL